MKKNVRNAKKNMEKKVAEEGKKKPKQFFQYVNKEKSNRVKVGPLKDEQGNLVAGGKEKAELLNKQYSSVFTRVEGGEVPRCEKKVEEGKEIHSVEFTPDKVLKKIETLRQEAAGGPDGIPPRVLKEIKEEIGAPLSILYQR